jgi:hypothetical protein
MCGVAIFSLEIALVCLENVTLEFSSFWTMWNEVLNFV